MAQNQEEFVQLLKAVNQGILAEIRIVLEHYGLPLAALPILNQLRREEGITVSELARRTSLAKSQVSTTVDSLVLCGWLEKRFDPADQRLVRLYPTQQAEQQMGAMRLERDQRLSRLISALSAEKVEAVMDGLRALKAALDANPAPGPEPELDEHPTMK